MSSYVVKISDSGGKTLKIDVNLPFVGASQTPDNPDSNWTTETSGLIAVAIGRCNVLSSSSSTSSSGSSLSSGSDGGSDGAADGGSSSASDGGSDGSSSSASDGGSSSTPTSVRMGPSDLYLCNPLAPYGWGIILSSFQGTFTDNGSGSGQLASAWGVSGGLAVGAITWITQ